MLKGDEPKPAHMRSPRPCQALYGIAFCIMEAVGRRRYGGETGKRFPGGDSPVPRQHVPRRAAMFYPLTVGDFLDRAVNAYPDRIAVVDEPDQPAPSLGELTHRQMATNAKAQAAKLD